MITFSNLGHYGRLGNAMWQYAALKGIALKTGLDAVIPNPATRNYHNQYCLLNNFNLSLPYWDTNSPIKINNLYKQVHDPQLFDEHVFSMDNTDFLGYFQNTKYFEGFEKEIQQDFQFTGVVLPAARRLFYRFCLDNDIVENVVGIHVKRGELVNETNELGNNFYEDIFLPYLNQAMNIFTKLCDPLSFIVFTNSLSDFNKFGTTDDALGWCKKHIYGENIHYWKNQETIIDLAVMTLCDHFITCHSTTFGWWAAYLNQNNGVIVAPRYYFMDRERFVDGFYPKDWVLI